MTRIRTRTGIAILLSIVLTALFPLGLFAAEDSLSVTVTPPLFQLTIGPGESWTSAIKIVNANSYEVTYFATPVNFESDGERGTGRFIPLVDDGLGSAATLGRWIEIAPDPVVIPSGRSAEIPFTVRVPANAEPGGHYAALLVGTKPVVEDLGGPAMRISSFVSSLLFVRIKGDIVERGRIREFSSKQSFYQSPKADFLLRFENTGNTHLKPRGEIILYNMWGKERGKVSINQESNFGNVMPESIRRFEFSWEGERSVTDIGRYSAVVTLAYGDDSKQSASATTYFWVIPIVPVSITFGSLLAFILVFTWLIRRYIRRALALEKQRHGAEGAGLAEDIRANALEALMEPLKEGALDLRSIGKPQVPQSLASRQAQEGGAMPRTADSLSLFGFLQKYSLFFFFVAMMAAGSFAVWMYLGSVLEPERSFEITEVTAGEEALEPAQNDRE